MPLAEQWGFLNFMFLHPQMVHNSQIYWPVSWAACTVVGDTVMPQGTAPSRWKRDGIKQNKSWPKGFASFSSHVSMGGLKATARAVWLDWAVSDLESSAGIYQLTKSVRIHWWWPRSLSTASKQPSPAGFRYEVVQSWERYSGQSRLISYHSSSRRRGQYHEEPPNVTGDVLSATITDFGSEIDAKEFSVRL